jgi:signal transduction histidine kinase
MEVVVVFFAIFYRYKVYRDEGLRLKYKLLETEAMWKQQEINGRKDERKRIAMDIHDGIGSRLFGARIKLDSLIRSSLISKTDCNVISEELLFISRELKVLILGLSKDESNTQTQLDILQKRLEELFFHSNKSINFKFQIESAILVDSFLLDVQLIFMELANNVLKHSSCREVNASILIDGNFLRLIWNEMPVTLTKLKGNGLGLMSIELRCKKWGGKMQSFSSPYQYLMTFEYEKVLMKNHENS